MGKGRVEVQVIAQKDVLLFLQCHVLQASSLVQV